MIDDQTEHLLRVIGKLRARVAELESDDGPQSWVALMTRNADLLKENLVLKGRLIPLSDEKAEELFLEWYDADESGDVLVRMVEKAHGI
jgi:hypothetical protein